jgi:squalene-hopene/tetraprenyl-beta-curcumene cyclase
MRKHYSLDENPGLGASGLFYYYMVLARTFKVLELDALRDPEGVERRPFLDLAAALLARQKADGSWVNEGSGRWWEDNPALCTAYAVLALSEAYGAMEE